MTHTHLKLSLNQLYIPVHCWKIANVVLIYKSGSRHLTYNYKLNFCYGQRSRIHNQGSYPTSFDCQWTYISAAAGFLPHHSCTSQLELKQILDSLRYSLGYIAIQIL